MPLKFPLPHLGCQIGVNFTLTPPKSRSIIAPCVCPRPASAPLPRGGIPPARLRSAATAPLPHRPSPQIRRRGSDPSPPGRWRATAQATTGWTRCSLRRVPPTPASTCSRNRDPPAARFPPTWLGVARSQLPGRRAELPQHRPVLGLHSRRRRSAGRGSRNPSRSCQPHSRRPQDQWRVEPTGSRWRRARPAVGLRRPCEFHPTGTSRRFPCYWPCRRTGGRTCGRTGGWRSSSWRQCCVRPCCRL